MSITLADIEQRIENLIEIHLVKFLPGQFWHDRIASRLTESLKVCITENDINSEITPNFTLHIHPTVLSEWQKEPRLLDGLTKIFRLAVNEANINFKSAPTITLAALDSLGLEDIEVHVNGKSTAETQGAQNQELPGETSELARTAFLIIGGAKVYTIDQMVINIGRRLDNQIVIDDPRVSRYHAQIRFVRDKFVIFDLNSTGGTYVNGQRTSQSVLYPGDVISLAGMPIIFGQDTPPPGLRLTSGDTAPLSQQNSERDTASLTTPLENEKNEPRNE
jgi:hypothetical protein